MCWTLNVSLRASDLTRRAHAAGRWAGVVINASLVSIAIMQKRNDYAATILSNSPVEISPRPRRNHISSRSGFELLSWRIVFFCRLAKAMWIFAKIMNGPSKIETWFLCTRDTSANAAFIYNYKHRAERMLLTLSGLLSQVFITTLSNLPVPNQCWSHCSKRRQWIISGAPRPRSHRRVVQIKKGPSHLHSLRLYAGFCVKMWKSSCTLCRGG